MSTGATTLAQTLAQAGGGGFDVVLGNPPWERVKLQEQEFFASRSEAIAKAPNAAARKKLIAALPQTDPALAQAWSDASRQAEGESHFLRQSGRYPLCGRGDINTYAVFAEHNRAVLGDKGRAGFIVPTGIATDDTTKAFFGDLVGTEQLAAFYGFENEAKLFAGIDHRVNFCLLLLSQRPISRPRFVAFARDPDVLRYSERVYELSASDLRRLNPNTGTCPVFRSRRDADINLAIYRRTGVLWREDDEAGNPWNLRFMAMLHMANDSDLFRTRPQLEGMGARRKGNTFEQEGNGWLPLIEAKMVYHFNHRYGDFALLDEGEREHILPAVPDALLANPEYSLTPRYWVAARDVEERLAGVWGRGWLLGWRDVTDARSSARTVIASLVPRVAVNDKLLLMLPDAEPNLVACLYANLCSFVLDYCARQKVGGTSLKYFTMRQLPGLPPSTYVRPTPWAPDILLRDWIAARVLELTYTAHDMAPFARDLGYEGPPFRWDPERRFALRCELDAAFFWLYGLGRDEVAYVMETFPIVKKRDEKEWGAFRTGRRWWLGLRGWWDLRERRARTVSLRAPLVKEVPNDGPGRPVTAANTSADSAASGI